MSASSSLPHPFYKSVPGHYSTQPRQEKEDDYTLAGGLLGFALTGDLTGAAIGATLGSLTSDD